MATRKIKVVSTVGVSGVLETDVTTVGELKPLLMDRGINFSGMKMMVGETRNELSVDEAVLPEGDFKLYLMPEKTKSGGSLGGFADRLRAKAEELDALADELDEHVCSNGACLTSEDDADVAEARAIANGTAGPARPVKKTSNWLS